MVDRKQVNVDRFSPAFLWKISPTCSVLNRDGLVDEAERKKSEKRSVLEGETVTF